MELDGRIAVVTGAASGMGLAAVKALAGAGATVYGMDLRQEDLDRAFAGLERVVGQAADVSDSTAVQRVFDRVRADHGRLHLLVNAAGVATPDKDKQAWVDGINHRMT